LVWGLDAFDYHTVTITGFTLAEELDMTPITLALALTATLITRPIGAAIFGLAADFYGRRYPFIVDCLFLVVFELGTSWSQTPLQFLAIRSCFGLAMGGLYGNAAATALEDASEESRGLLSGIFQSGYPFGYLLAAVFWKAFRNLHENNWQSLFRFAACIPVLLIVVRWFLDETETYNKTQKQISVNRPKVGMVFADIKAVMKKYWGRMGYLVLLMTIFSMMVRTRHGLSFLNTDTKSSRMLRKIYIHTC
jgi:SHS family lactate transporter-like MFS transporter